jgi:hypothetical protein
MMAHGSGSSLSVWRRLTLLLPLVIFQLLRSY